MLTVYEERGIAKGTLQTLRRTLSKLLRARFGELPERVVARIEAMESEAELDALLERVLMASSLEEMGLNEGIT
jgi:hypothetical protein